MYPELFTIPIVDITIKSYGFCLMVGFLSAVWLGMRRCERTRVDPDVFLDLALLCLIFGVGGSRLFYVIHYWPTKFASAPSPLLAAIDITKGGLEFLGGFVGAVLAIIVYSLRKKISLRFYLDTLAPSTMWGLAFGRLGCYLNGCCFGALCVAPGVAQSTSPVEHPRHAWAVEFPFGSPAHLRQWENRKVTVPADLIATDFRSYHPMLLSSLTLTMSEKDRKAPRRAYADAKKAYEFAVAQGDNEASVAALGKTMKRAQDRKKARDMEMYEVLLAQQYPSRTAPRRPTSITELQTIAGRYHSAPVHPAQLYSAIHAMILAVLLSGLFYARKRHGVVAAALLLCYPLPRILLEMIRSDNPHDVGGFTVSQFVSLALFAAGVVALYVIHTRLPERSPLLKAYDPESEDE